MTGAGLTHEKASSVPSTKSKGHLEMGSSLGMMLILQRCGEGVKKRLLLRSLTRLYEV
jgi:hypothetical protein